MGKGFEYSVKSGLGSLKIEWAGAEPPKQADIEGLLDQVFAQFPEVTNEAAAKEEAEGRALDESPPDRMSQKQFEKWRERHSKKSLSEMMVNESRTRRPGSRTPRGSARNYGKQYPNQ